jgi:hypothetical protein
MNRVDRFGYMKGERYRCIDPPPNVVQSETSHNVVHRDLSGSDDPIDIGCSQTRISHGVPASPQREATGGTSSISDVRGGTDPDDRHLVLRGVVQGLDSFGHD